MPKRKDDKLAEIASPPVFEVEGRKIELRPLTAEALFDLSKAISRLFSKVAIFGRKDADPEALGAIILASLPDCKEDFFIVVSKLTGLSTQEVSELPGETFLEIFNAVLNNERTQRVIKGFFETAARMLPL